MNAAQTLAFAVDLHRWLEADQDTPVAQRNRRDRTIGRELDVDGDLPQLNAWWARLEQAGSTVSPGQRVLTIKRWMTAALFVFGALVGGSATSVALSYDGDYPVNLLALLGVLIGLPGVLLVMTLAGMLLRASHWTPLAKLSAQVTLNRWLIGLWDRVSGLTLNANFGQANARGALAYWQLMLFSQWFAVGFFVGVAAVFMMLVAVTDLAFGWSTTLEVEAQRIYRWTAALSWPWAQAVPVAAPTLELVEVSRFYRLADVEQGAQTLGGWWPFVLMSVLVWGLLPRLLLLGVCVWQTKAAAVAYLREHSEVSALLDRLRAPALRLGEDVEAPAQAGAATPPDHKLPIQFSNAAAVSWNGAHPVGQIGQAGELVALSSTDSDVERRQSIQGLAKDAEQVMIFTKGWEPPLLEFLDLLRDIRDALGAAPSIVVAPVGLADQALGPTDLAVWRQSVASLGDARTYVSSLEEAP